MIIVKRPRATKASTQLLFKKLDETLDDKDWSNFAGWLDSDAYFKYKRTKNKVEPAGIGITLTDQDCVAYFAKTFECSLTGSQLKGKYYKNPKDAKIAYHTILNNQKAHYFLKKVGPFILNKNHEVHHFLKLLKDKTQFPYMEMSDEHFMCWSSSFFEGDGGITLVGSKERKKWQVRFSSNNKSLLQYIKDRYARMHFCYFTGPYHVQKKGKAKFQHTENTHEITRKDGYAITLNGRKCVPFLEFMLPRIHVERKRQKCIRALIELTDNNKHVTQK